MRFDPLEEMLSALPDKLPPRARDEMQLRACTYLDILQEKLDNPPAPPKKIDYYSKSTPAGLFPIYSFDPSDLPRAQELYKRVAMMGGSGVTYEQQYLIRLIATSLATSSIPFWQELLDFTGRPRDAFTPERRVYALAALALLCVTRDSQEARDTLLQATRHNNPDVRAMAAYYLAESFLAMDQDLPEPVTAALRQLATEDESFEPRYQARLALRYSGFPVPLDNPNGTYALEVKLQWAPETIRTIEIRSKQTLEDLHLAIQKAFDWGADHLYSFYMRGKELDDLYEIQCVELSENTLFPIGLFAAPNDRKASEREAEQDEEDDTLYTHNAIIGELGLVKGHKFVYFFDFGDSHVFWVKVVNINPKAEKGRYPRVVNRAGPNPTQYEEWDDEDEEDE